MAIVMYIQLASQVLTGSSALARCYTILAHVLQYFSPRDSITFAIKVASYGSLVKTTYITDALKALNIDK